MNSRFLKYPIFAFAIIMVLSACNARRQNTLFNDPSDLVADTLTNVYVVNDQGPNDHYRIKPDDRLVIKNLQQKEFLKAASASIASQTQDIVSYQVDSTGSVNLPEYGKIQVGGLNRRQVNQKMQEILEKGLNSPIIEVTIINLKVTLLGEFAKQGNFLLERDNITLIDIIGEAGGISNQADPKTLKIIRGWGKPNPEIIRVNLNNINSLTSKKLVLQNNDIISIMQQKSYATAAKLQGINNYIQPALVLLNLGLLILTITK